MTYNEIVNVYNSIKDRIPFTPSVGLILGSGLGAFAEKYESSAEIPYNEIEGFPVSTVEGHDGRFIFAKIHDVPVVMMKGRVHLYEGYSPEEVVLPIRVMKLMGIEKLVITNAAGGINTGFTPGTLMVIKDQITSFIPSPLIGKNIPEFETRFPDMSSVYDPALFETVIKTAARKQISVREGVYVQTTGPNYETPAEIRAFRTLGADAVGMSTAIEAMVANAMGIKVCGVSCISNMASGITSKPLTHKEISEVAARVSESFETLIDEVIGAL